MRFIYHLVPKTDWESIAPGSYQAESLTTEGFIHCSNRDQVEWVANQFYSSQTNLLVLKIDAARLTSPLRDEDPGVGRRYPHVYGAIERDAIVEVHSMIRGPEGCWHLPAGIRVEPIISS